MKTISRYLLTLVALFAMTAGAWAEETATITLKCGTTEKTYENVTLPWSTTAEILKEVVTDLNFNVNINAISGGDGKVVKYGNENFTVNGTFSGDATVTVTYNMGSSATITVTAPAPLIALNDTKTEATMAAMPASDVTIDYELVRDMEVDVNAYVGTDANTTYRHRVEKVDANTYSPVGITTDAQLIALFPVIDVIDAQNPKALTYGTDYTVTVVDAEQNEIAISEFSFAPGTYSVKVTGMGDYDGQIDSQNDFTLYMGYEIKVGAKEFATFYKEEAIYTEDEAVELYTVKSVNEDKAVLSKKLDIVPPYVPMLVYNNSDQAKTILLIPTELQTSFMWSRYFKGTLEATTIAASTDTKNNYALNGKQFVWVKNDIAVDANKCWLEITPTDGSLTLGAPAISIVFGEGTTGIDSMVNGSMVNDQWYTIDGRKVTAPTKKGIYVKNGKKVVVK